MLELIYLNKTIGYIQEEVSVSDIKSLIKDKTNGSEIDTYVVVNGKRIANDTILREGRVHIIPCLGGGKGGFGSMLRAIGAQIEKTTNREACRDLSGRRLRDINEEKRLKTWLAQQIDREKDAAEKKQKKLEKLCQEPKFEFKDEHYEKVRAILPEKVEDAVLQGLKLAEQKQGQKRAAKGGDPVKKKSKLWLDADIDDMSSNDSVSEEDAEKPSMGKEGGDLEKSSSSKVAESN